MNDRFSEMCKKTIFIQVDESENGSPEFNHLDVNLEPSDLPKILSEIDRLSSLIGQRLNILIWISPNQVTLPATPDSSVFGTRNLLEKLKLSE